MTTTMAAPASISTHASVLALRPHFEGCNIGTWIGFKHVMYSFEEAVLGALRERDVRPGRLFERHALALELVDTSVRLTRGLDVDDELRAEVRPLDTPGEPELGFAVALFVAGAGAGDAPAASGRVKLLFRQAASSAGMRAPLAPPDWIAPHVVAELRRESPAGPHFTAERGQAPALEDVLGRLAPPGSNAFVWRWRVPYFYCHYTERLQHSGYVRLLEEVVDLFLARRGLAIPELLRGRAWIPVVSAARVELLREAYMGEELYTVFTVDDVFKDTAYSAHMECYVPREGGLVRTARAAITHAYLKIEGRGREASLVRFDADVRRALVGETARP